MLIDFHTHCFPDKIAASAIAKLESVSGGLRPYTNGTLTDTRRAMDEYGVDLSVVMNIATNAHQKKSVNDFAAQINQQKNIVSFGSVYPHSPDVLEELERIKALEPDIIICFGLTLNSFALSNVNFTAEAISSTAIVTEVSRILANFIKLLSVTPARPNL